MSTGASILRLIAAREIRERLRTRAFRVMTVLTLLIVIGSIAIPSLQGSDPPVYDVGLVAPASEAIHLAVEGIGPQIGADVDVVDLPDAATAEAAVRTGKVDVAVVGAEQLIIGKAIERGDGSRRARMVVSVAEAVRLQVGLERAGLQADKAAAALASPPPRLVAQRPSSTDDSRRFTALAGLVLLYVQLLQYGGWVLFGVIEEKSSRVIEVLLSAVRPGQLLAGKVVGIGLLALGHSLLLVVAALVTASVTGSDLLQHTAFVPIVTTAGWFLLGYALYCTLYAAAGSLVSRQEDAQNVSAPLMLPMLAAYFTSITALTGGDASMIVKVLAYVPLTAPFAMPVLVAIGAVHPWQVAVSVAITLGAAILLGRGAAAIYSRSVLRTGQRIRWRDAMRRSPAVEIPASA